MSSGEIRSHHGPWGGNTPCAQRDQISASAKLEPPQIATSQIKAKSLVGQTQCHVMIQNDTCITTNITSPTPAMT